MGLAFPMGGKSHWPCGRLLHDPERNLCPQPGPKFPSLLMVKEVVIQSSSSASKGDGVGW